MLERLSQIDELTFGDHYYLGAEDQCIYYGDYTARRGFAFSETNQLIHNLKKPVSLRGQNQYHYKEVAIDQIARAIVRDVPVDRVTFVPVPPSKMQTDPDYDDRIVQILARCNQLNPNVDFRELVTQTQTMVAAHTTNIRPRPADLEAIYAINQVGDTPLREVVIVLDDMLTTGCHFVAIRSVLLRAYPGIQIVGLFVARRVPEAEDLENVFTDLTL